MVAYDQQFVDFSARRVAFERRGWNVLEQRVIDRRSDRLGIMEWDFVLINLVTRWGGGQGAESREEVEPGLSGMQRDCLRAAREGHVTRLFQVSSSPKHQLSRWLMRCILRCFQGDAPSDVASTPLGSR